VAEEMVEVITTAKIIVDEVSTAGGELNAANEEPVSTAPTNITTAQPNKAIKTTVDITTTPKAKGIVFHDIEESTTRKASSKSQIAIDEEVARRIEAEWNADMQDNIDWNQVVEQVQSRQSDAIRKYQAFKIKPVSVAQDRKNMMIYLKNMARFKMEFFKGMSYEEIRPLFEEEYNKVQTLFKKGTEMDAERIKAPRKRTRKEKVEIDQTAKKQKGDELKKDNAEKQTLEEQQEAEELKKNLEIVPDDEDDVFVNVAPLSSKPPTIMDNKIYKEGKKKHFQIIRANEKMYPLTNYTLQQMFNEVGLQVDYEVEMAYDLLRLKTVGQNQQSKMKAAAQGMMHILMMQISDTYMTKSQWLRVDQYTEQCQVQSPILDSSPDNQTTEYSKQSLESENILLKKTVTQFQKDFSRMEAHCIALELKYQNQALKSGQHGQILNETSNKAKIKKEIDVLETMNIELEHSVAKLLKENETLKKHYKYLYDSIKITRSKTIEQTTSLLANNVDLKAQIQEKVFAIAALKNDLRKLKGNSVDTKFAKTSVLVKPVLQSLINQSVFRQPNAFKSEWPQMSKLRFASQVDVNNNFSRPVTQHYLPKGIESTFAKPNHMIASSSFRNSSKNMPRFSSNDMVHNHYLDEARKKTQERDMNSKTSVMPSARFQSTVDDSKPKPRSTNHSTKSFPISKSSCVTIAAVPIADHSKNSNSFSYSKHFVCTTCTKLKYKLGTVIGGRYLEHDCGLSRSIGYSIGRVYENYICSLLSFDGLTLASDKRPRGYYRVKLLFKMPGQPLLESLKLDSVASPDEAVSWGKTVILLSAL
nr:probable RNA 3'-terminal phosphate cyclase-like protein [Tanacetum cinerariifolium]